MTTSNVLIRNEEELEFADFAGSPFVGRYPGSLANGVMVSVADNASFDTWPFRAQFEYKPTPGLYSIAIVDTKGTINGLGSAYQEFNITIERIRTPKAPAESTISLGGAAVAYSTSDTMEALLTKVITAFNQASNNSASYEILGTKVSGNTAVISMRNKLLGNDTPAIVGDQYLFIAGSVTKGGGYGSVIEKFESVSLDKNSRNEDNTSNYAIDIINRTSQWIYISPLSVTLKTGDFVLDGGVDDYDTTLYDGIAVFKNADKFKFNYLFGALRPLEKKLLHEVAESRHDCLAFIAPDRDDVVNNRGREMEAVIDFRNVRFNIDSTYVFTTDNWAQVYDQYNNKFRWIPTCGGTAGLKARATNEFNAWTSPAGHNRGGYLGYQKLAWSAEKGERDELYKIGVNSVVDFGDEGIKLFGDKMTTSRPTAFSRINVRSAFIVAEQSIANYAKYYFFENNNVETRSQFLNAVNPFFRTMVTDGAFEKVETQVDENNNPLSVRQENRFVGNFRIWPQYSINFIDLFFEAVGSDVSFTETSN